MVESKAPSGIFNKEYILKALLSLLFFLVIGCGGGSTDSVEDSQNGSFVEPVLRNSLINIALPSNGTTISASYDQVSAQNVVDGDVTGAFTWSGNLTADYLELDFGEVAYLDSIKIYADPIFFPNFSGVPWIVEVSEDGDQWLRAFFFGIPPSGERGISCDSMRLVTAEKSMFCPYGDETSQFSFGGIDARFLRITIIEPDAAEVLSTFLYEIEIWGI